MASHAEQHVRFEYVDFILRVGPRAGGRGEKGHYPVDITSPVGEGPFRMRSSLEPFEAQLEGLEGAVFRSRSSPAGRAGEASAGPLTVEQQLARSFGEALFKAVLPTPEARRYFRESIEELDTPHGLRIKLQIEAPDLEGLPWELLRDPDASDFAGLRISTPIVRDLRQGERRKPLAVVPPLRILGMIANPKPPPGKAELNVADERNKIESALKDLQRDGLVEVTWIDGQTVDHLREALRRPYHIFHFIGHGGYHPNLGGYILLTDELGDEKPLPATELVRVLERSDQLRLVVLNSCETARGSGSDNFPSSAATLVREGKIPAVLAMQLPFSDTASRKFASAFYRAIADRLPIDAALTEARIAISNQNPRSLEWATPVLIQRSPDGVLFDITPKPPWWRQLPAIVSKRRKPLLAATAAAGLAIASIGYYLYGPGASCRSIRDIAGNGGGHLVYATDFGGGWHLRSYSFANCESVELQPRSPAVWRPALSHSGSEIAYLNYNRNCRSSEIWRSSGGGEPALVYTSPESNICYVFWDADDEHMLITDDRVAQLGEIDAAGGGGPLARVGPEGVTYVSYAPDGSAALAKRQDIFWQETTDATPVPVATTVGDIHDMPNIGPDGQRVAYQVNHGGVVQRQIFYVLAPGEEPQELTEIMGNNYNPVWSPNGDAIAYISVDNSDNTTRIMVEQVVPEQTEPMLLDLGSVESLPNTQISYLTWSP